MVVTIMLTSVSFAGLFPARARMLEARTPIMRLAITQATLREDEVLLGNLEVQGCVA